MPLAQKGSLVLDYATEADAEDCGGMFAAAFHDHPYFQRMQPDTPAARKAWTKCTSFVLKDPYTIVLKVTDSDTGKIVSHGRWVKPREETDEQQPGQEPDRWNDDFMATCDEETATALFGSFEKNHHEMMGDRRHYYMELLETAEGYKGRGAGSLILQHGCDLADKDGLECYIDSSPAGKPLYQRFGFEFTVVEQLPMGYHYNFGIRPPKKQSA